MHYKVTRKVNGFEGYHKRCTICAEQNDDLIKYVIQDLDDYEYPRHEFYCCEDCAKKADFVELRIMANVNEVTLNALSKYK